MELLLVRKRYGVMERTGENKKPTEAGLVISFLRKIKRLSRG
jgi:hypothetical protein